MWKRMGEIWIWIGTIINFVVAFGLAQLLVSFGLRWSFIVDRPLDASDSVLGFTVLLGVFLPIIFLLFVAMISDGLTPKAKVE